MQSVFSEVGTEILYIVAVELEETSIARKQHGNNMWTGVFYAVRAKAT
jgi:hypothetical protein